MSQTAAPPTRRPGRARVLTEADLDLELAEEAGHVGNGDSHGHGHGHGTVGSSARRPGRARVLTEADLDLELAEEAGHVGLNGDSHGHGHGHGHGDLGHGHGDLGHGHSHSRVFRAYGRCHGFDVDVSTGGWFNAGHADNLFGGTGFGRRIVPVKRAARLRRRLYGALCVSGLYAIAEFTAATISGSTALLADGLHMTSDFVSYGLSLGILELTLRQQRRHLKLKDSDSTEADATRDDDYAEMLTFGFARLEVLGALGIILVVWGATLALVVEAIKRMSAPPGVDGATVVFTACGGLVVDVVLLWLLDRDPGGGNSNGHGHSHGTGELGARAMFLHVLGDLFGTILVCVGGAIIWGTGGRDSNLAVIDPVCTLCFACIVVATMYPFALRMLRVLLEAAPPGASTRKIADALESEVPGVVGVHCLHLWELSPGKSALMAHVHVLTQEKERAGEALERALSRATRLLQKKFGINHTTLQMTATPEKGGWAACGMVGKPPVKCDKCDALVDAASNV